MSEAEAKQAMETMKCPRCGARLHYRDVVNDNGDDGVISKKFGELADVYGHSFSVLIKDFIKAREGKAI